MGCPCLRFFRGDAAKDGIRMDMETKFELWPFVAFVAIGATLAVATGLLPFPDFMAH
jgi:hypothetical protein